MMVKEIFVKFGVKCTGRNNLVKIQENYMGRQNLSTSYSTFRMGEKKSQNETGTYKLG
jgi:hypothetical protein